MPHRVPWNDAYETGDAAIDAQHRRLLAHCDALADCLAEGSAEEDATFRRILDELVAQARAHFAAEEAALVAAGYPRLDDYRQEREEFDFLTTDVATPENFDKLELQRFLALWWVGHILEVAKAWRVED